MTYTFSERGSAQAVEEGAKLAPKFDADGLITCVATDAASGDVLMVAHMNAEALARTIESGEAWPCQTTQPRKTSRKVSVSRRSTTPMGS